MRKKRVLCIAVICMVVLAVVGGIFIVKLKPATKAEETGARETAQTQQPEKLTGIQTSKTTAKQRAFGEWVNESKYMSYDDLLANMTPDTLPVFGSSEFNHLGNTPYHPTNIFKNTNVFPMIIGTAYNQTLSLTTYLGALEPKLESKKVVLMLSPVWFYTSGVSKEDYSLRFSELSYVAFLQNEDIPEKVKTYVATRSEALLAGTAVSKYAVAYNKVYLTKDASEEDKALASERLAVLREKNHNRVASLMSSAGISGMSDELATYDADYVPDWEGLAQQAIGADQSRRNNAYYVDDSRWASKYGPLSKELPGMLTGASMAESPEYEDLKAFLDICKACDIKPLLVMEPMNGYWYDAADFGAEKRQQFVDNINKIAKDYGVKAVSFQDYEYEKYFLLDSCHLAGEGWTRCCKEIFEFVNQ